MQVTFNSDHDNPKDCQLIIAVTGSKEYIQSKLYELINECKSSYGKPKQGQIWSSKGIIDIITPMWKEKKY